MCDPERSYLLRLSALFIWGEEGSSSGQPAKVMIGFDVHTCCYRQLKLALLVGSRRRCFRIISMIN